MQINKRFIIIVLMLIAAGTGCSSFVPDDDAERLTLKYRTGDYILLEDITRNDVTLTKGTVVKLTFVAGDDWVKIYAYDKKEELLTSRRQLLIYMFEDDFPDEEFKPELLEAELAKIVKAVNSSADNSGKSENRSGKKTK